MAPSNTNEIDERIKVVNIDRLNNRVIRDATFLIATGPEILRAVSELGINKGKKINIVFEDQLMGTIAVENGIALDHLLVTYVVTSSLVQAEITAVSTKTPYLISTTVTQSAGMELENILNSTLTYIERLQTIDWKL